MNTNKLKLMDGLLVWGICFLLFGILGDLLSGVIGIWAFYLCQALSIVTVLVVAAKTGLSMPKLFTAGEKKTKQIVGATLIWVGCLLIVIPLFLLSHLLMPALAKTGLHIYQYTSSHWAVGGLVLLAGFAESLLFDGFLFVRFKGLGKAHFWIPYLLFFILGGLYHPDLYILLPMAVMAVGLAYVRSRINGIALPMLLRMLTILIALAYMQVSDAGESLMGSSMGIVQVIGFSLIFMGAALPSVVCGAGLLGDFKDRSLFEKGMIIAISVVLIASGCGISTF